MDSIDAASWDALVQDDDPFSRHAYLRALEATGCVGPHGTGWLPIHLVVYDDKPGGKLVAAMPLYLKTDSYGEFIFDWAWADASMRAGLPYYPKLVAAIPFTPASGRRLLRGPNTPLAEVAPLLARGLEAVANNHGASSVHILFCQQDEAQALEQAGYISRQSCQFHWQRAPHWQCFDDFLADMRAPSRKQVRKERARAQSHGLALSFRPIHEVGAEDVRALYAFYRHTVWEKGAQAYLTQDFFASLHAQGNDRVLVAMAHDGVTPVAGALFFTAGAHMYGRYWGATRHYDALHFELCYYLPIAWCLQHGISRFEAGAQGEHKIKRGLMPNSCHSAHWLRHPGLRDAVAQFCHTEAQATAHGMAQLAAHGPFHRLHTDTLAEP